MAITATEQRESRSGKSSAGQASSVDYLYRVRSDSSSWETVEDMLDAVDSAAPLSIVDPAVSSRTLVRGDVDWSFIGKNLMDVRMGYIDQQAKDNQTKPALGDYRISFSTTGGTVKITASLAQTKYPAATAPDQGKSINVTPEGEVQGADVVEPRLKYTISYTIAKATVTSAYVKTLAGLTSKTNDATFFGFAAGEVLFLGADGTDGINADPTINYHFAVSENVTGLELGTITGVAKQGHQFLWVRFENEEVGTGANKRILKTPKYVYVDTVYEDDDMSTLGIGTS